MGTYTPNRGYSLPTIAGDATTWGAELNQSMTLIDTNLGGVVQVNVAGNANVVASATQAQNMAIELTGALLGNIEFQLPQTGGMWIISNQTTGAYTLEVTTSSTSPTATGTTIPQGTSVAVWSDGTNVFRATSDTAPAGGATFSGPVLMEAGATVDGALSVSGTITANIGPKIVGEVFDYAGATVPPGCLLCYGQAISRTTYVLLFNAIGTTWGTGDGSTTFNVPDARGRGRYGADAMGGTAANRLTTASLGVAATLGVAGGSELLQSHAHTLTDPGHNHAHTDPGHTHAINDPGHAHAISDPGHNHTLTDPGHAHTISDPGHSHNVAVGGAAGSGYPDLSNSFAGGYEATQIAGTNIGINVAGTGLGITAATTGISVAAHLTGVYNAAATTGITNTANTTGITMATAGSGGSQNLPPAAVYNTLIFAGV